MKSLKFLYIGLSLIGLALILFIILLGVGWDKFGPFHRSALVFTPEKEVEINDKQYFLVNYDLYENLNGEFKKVNYLSNVKIPSPIYDISSNDNKICIANNDKIIILDENFQTIDSIEDFAFHVLIRDNFVFYHSITSSSVQDNENKVIYQYNLETKETIKVSVLEKNNVYAIDGKQIYLSNEGEMFFVEDFLVSNEIYRFYGSSFYAKNDCYKISINEGKLLIQNSQSTLDFDIEINQNQVEKVEILNSKAVFTTYELLENSECCEIDGNCICHKGKTIVWEFDFESLTLTKLCTLDKGSFVIRANSNYYIYYIDGKIYKNNDVLRTIDKIEPNGSYYTFGEKKFVRGDEHSLSIFYFNGETLSYSTL